MTYKNDINLPELPVPTHTAGYLRESPKLYDEVVLLEYARAAVLADRERRDTMVCISDYEALQAECEALRKDAERYRWLRDGCDQKVSEATRIATNCYGLEWDSRIDAAMAKEAEK